MKGRVVKVATYRGLWVVVERKCEAVGLNAKPPQVSWFIGEMGSSGCSRVHRFCLISLFLEWELTAKLMLVRRARKEVRRWKHGRFKKSLSVIRFHLAVIRNRQVFPDFLHKIFSEYNRIANQKLCQGLWCCLIWILKIFQFFRI